MEKERRSRKRKGDYKESKGKKKKAKQSLIEEEAIEELPIQELSSTQPQDVPQQDSIVVNKDSYNSFWLREVAKRENSDLLKLELTEGDLRDSLPVYIDKGDRINKDLGPFFNEPELENSRVLSIFGIPGLGKTSTIQAFAIRYKCKYIRFTATRGLIGSMICFMDKICNLVPISAKELMLKLNYISFRTIRAILQHTAEATKQQRVIRSYCKSGLRITDEEVLQSKDIKQLEEAVVRARSVLVEDQSLSDDKIVIVHFDECQDWISPGQTRKYNDELILTGEEAKMYRLISFSECLKHTPENIRFAFTGTHIKVDSLLRFDSSMKLYTKMDVITMATAEDIKYLLDLFVDVSKIDDSIIRKLVGPYRIVHFFLHHLYAGEPPEEAKESAFNDWHSMPQRPFQDSAGLADSLLLFYFAGTALAHQKSTDGSIIISRDLIDTNWLNWAQFSLIKMNENQDGNYTITPPFPFLLRLLFKNTVLLDFKHKDLMCQFQAPWIDAKTGRGYIFQWAIPIELQLPHSPLVLQLLERIKECFHSQNVKFPKFKSKIGYFETNAEAVKNAQEDYISVSFDANRSKVKAGDLSMIVLVDNNRMHVRCEAKSRISMKS